MTSTDVARPSQGDIWLTSFGAAKAGEPGKNRPAIVVSADNQMTGSIYDLIAMIPISSALPPSLVRPPLAATDDTGLQVPSVAVVRAIRGMSPARLLRRLGHTDATTMREIQEILTTVLGL